MDTLCLKNKVGKVLPFELDFEKSLMRYDMKLNLIVGILALGFFSCGSKDSDEPATPPQPPIYNGPAFSLAGLTSTHWESECKLECDQKCSRKRQLHLDENTYRYEVFVYDGLECLESLKKVTYSEHYVGVTKNSKGKLSGWTSFAAITVKVLPVIHQDVLTMAFNHNSRFGFNNWVTGESKDVTGLKYDKDAEAENQKGSAWERTMKVDGDTLYLSKYKNNVPINEVHMSFKKI